METRSGRAEFRLAERAALWGNRREPKQLPTIAEWLTIAVLTAHHCWSRPGTMSHEGGGSTPSPRPPRVSLERAAAVLASRRRLRSITPAQSAGRPAFRSGNDPCTRPCRRTWAFSTVGPTARAPAADDLRPARARIALNARLALVAGGTRETRIAFVDHTAHRATGSVPARHSRHADALTDKSSLAAMDFRPVGRSEPRAAAASSCALATFDTIRGQVSARICCPDVANMLLLAENPLPS